MLHAQDSRFLFGGWPVGAIADHDQHTRKLAIHFCVGAHYIANTLYSAEVRHVHEDRLRRSELILEQRWVLLAVVDVGIDEIVDDIDVEALATEGAACFVAQVIRYRRDPI
jgi:hypothetical protein